MRSSIFSIALAVLALTTGAMAFLHLTQKNLSSLFGEPALRPGGLLFEFQPHEIQKISIDAGGRPQNYEEARGQWLLKTKTSPDRADYRALEALLAFSAKLTILESLPANSENLKATGLSPARAGFHFKTAKGKTVAQFAFGKQAAWHQHIPAPDAYSQAQDWPAAYLHPQDSKFIYLCSSPYLEDVLANGFSPQRDLRPFFFPPELLAEVTIVRPNGKLVLARQSPAANWRIEKPFNLEADSEAVGELVGGLYKLTAAKAVNKPAPATEEPSMQLALRFFALDGTVQEQAITLSLTEPDSTNTSTYLGRLDDWRKDIEFEIPRASRKGLLGVDELPLTIERLRGASLSGLDLRQLKKLRIMTPELQGPLDIEIGKSPISGEWRAQRTYQGETTPANELTFFTVKKVLTEEKAIATVSDAVSELASYGLKAPVMTLVLELFDGTKESIHFGEKIGENGIPRFFFRRNESLTVMELASDTFYRLASRPYLWRDARIWNFNIVDLNLLLIERPGTEPLSLDYSDLAQLWKARRGSTDVTALLNENKANLYLENLESLAVDRWLGPDHSPAANALRDPVFTLTALFQRPDDEDAPIETKVLRLAGAGQSGRNPFYYGQVKGDPHYFILDLNTVAKLAEPLLEENE